MFVIALPGNPGMAGGAEEETFKSNLHFLPWKSSEPFSFLEFPTGEAVAVGCCSIRMIVRVLNELCAELLEHMCAVRTWLLLLPLLSLEHSSVPRHPFDLHYLKLIPLNLARWRVQSGNKF